MIAATGYEPDQVAQSLVQHSSRILALALFYGEQGFSLSGLGQSRFYFYLRVLREIERATAAAGYDLLLPSRPHIDFEGYVRALKTRRVDGILMVAPYPIRERLPLMIKSGIPTVFLDVIGEGPKASYITVDHAGGCRQAIAHLLHLGHRRIAILTGEKANDQASQRLQGYQQALAEAGVVVDEQHIVYASFEREEAYQRTKALLAAHPGEFTALVAANDMMAIGAIQALRECNIRVPGEVSIIGFDDIDLCQVIDPPLTTIRSNQEMLARGAVQKLLDLIDGQVPVAPTTVSTHLVVRTSTGPVSDP